MPVHGATILAPDPERQDDGYRLFPRRAELRRNWPRLQVGWPPCVGDLGARGVGRGFFGIIGKYADAPPPAVSPLAWGDPSHVESLLGHAFELTFEHGANHAYHPSSDTIWDWYVRGFGPLRRLAASLPADRAGALKRDVDAFHEHYTVPAGLHVRRDYLLTIGRRR